MVKGLRKKGKLRGRRGKIWNFDKGEIINSVNVSGENVWFPVIKPGAKFP